MDKESLNWLHWLINLPASEKPAAIQSLTDEQRTKLDQFLLSYLPEPWTPLPGPQTQAYHCPADELLFGGAAGGGKTSLLAGLAFSAHHRSIIFRRESKQADEIIDQINDLTGGKGYNGSEHSWKLANGRKIEIGTLKDEDSWRKYAGRPHDAVLFDEITEIRRDHFVKLMAWNRTTLTSQRCRVVCTCNPPTSVEGRWIMEEWGPWLDPKYQIQAKDGELLWYTTIKDRLHWFRTGEPVKVGDSWVKPRSRTFIQSKVEDNPLLLATDYVSRLEALPEPLRSMMRGGDFRAAMQDDPWQVIPTAWLEAAFQRWTPERPAGQPLTALGVDCARGGGDAMAICKRYAHWVDKLIKIPGRQCVDGPTSAEFVVAQWEDDAEIILDVIGIGSAVYDALRGRSPEIKRRTFGLNAANSCEYFDRSKKYRLTNVRTAMYWKLREALEPGKGDNLAIPPDSELLAELCAAKFKVTARGIQVEPKEDIIQRISRSPDLADCVVMAFWPRPKLDVW